jgi:hypothetical protein
VSSSGSYSVADEPLARPRTTVKKMTFFGMFMEL